MIVILPPANVKLPIVEPVAAETVEDTDKVPVIAVVLLAGVSRPVIVNTVSPRSLHHDLRLLALQPIALNWNPNTSPALSLI